MGTDGKSLTTALFITMCVVMVTSYPHGAPDDACASLIPVSHGPSTATGPSPYSVSLSSATYSPNQVITNGAPDRACASLIPIHGPSTATYPSPYSVSLSSATYSPSQVITIVLGGAAFKGFLVVGRKDGTTDQVGSFQNPFSGSRLACATTPGSSGITHTDNTVKLSSVCEWRAPSTSVGAITFHFTVVRGGAPNTSPNASDYYPDMTSATIMPAGHNKVEVQHVKILRGNEKKDIERLSFEEIIYRAKPYSYA